MKDEKIDFLDGGEEKNERKTSREEGVKTRSESEPRRSAWSGVGERTMMVKKREERKWIWRGFWVDADFVRPM